MLEKPTMLLPVRQAEAFCFRSLLARTDDFMAKILLAHESYVISLALALLFEVGGDWRSDLECEEHTDSSVLFCFVFFVFASTTSYAAVQFVGSRKTKFSSFEQRRSVILSSVAPTQMVQTSEPERLQGFSSERGPEDTYKVQLILAFQIDRSDISV